MDDIIVDVSIEDKILIIRWEKILLDRDLAELYGVSTKSLKQAVRRNSKRFPKDFMFELDNNEFENWRSQFVTSNSWDAMWLRYRPFAFTEHWILMLSAVLRSKTAIDVSIHIIRIFNHMRKTLASNQLMTKKLHQIEQQVLENNESIQELRFEFKKVLQEDEIVSRKIWFITE